VLSRPANPYELLAHAREFCVDIIRQAYRIGEPRKRITPVFAIYRAQPRLARTCRGKQGPIDTCLRSPKNSGVKLATKHKPEDFCHAPKRGGDLTEFFSPAAGVFRVRFRFRSFVDFVSFCSCFNSGRQRNSTEANEENEEPDNFLQKPEADRRIEPCVVRKKLVPKKRCKTEV